MMSTETTLAERNKRTTRSLFIWTSGWVLSLALVAFGPKFLWDFAETYTLIAIAVNLFFGYKMILANKRHLDGCDELQRRIHFNAMAISLGVSMVFGALYGLLEAVRLLSETPNPANILFVMGISYMVSIFIGFRKYQ
ncbi:hypothetical protein CWI80_02065 [Pseudidiomarina sediminum]|uniref:DUF2178 domain-containing protein n=2 Tax=Pseudidiomarina sediminum TaxID=431675 RepID=A0A432Z8F6_9GAMM|nr:hypothetical protein CWI80_02065 [Pseudidiomarina sediminum]